MQIFIIVFGFFIAFKRIHAEILVLSTDDFGNEFVGLVSDDEYQENLSIQSETFLKTAEDYVSLAQLPK